MRFQPSVVLPKNYPFLKKHSHDSFITYTTYDFGAAAFTRKLAVKHDFHGVPLVDMWVSKVASTSGNAVTDKPTKWDTVYHSPLNLYSGTYPSNTLKDAYYAYADAQNVNVMIRHEVATSGTYHVYFHIKIYMDTFYDQLY